VSRRAFTLVGCALAIAWLGLALAQVCLDARHGFEFTWADLGRGWRGWFDPHAGLPGSQQYGFDLRVWRALTASGVGACLAVGGAMLQGLFRNALAEPALLGVSGGANLGATLAIMVLSGYSTATLGVTAGVSAPMLVTGAAFVGALLAALLVIALSRGEGPLDVVRLLLVGVTLNTLILGALTALQSLLLHDVEVSRALRTWTFGNLEDRDGMHAAAAGAGCLVAALAIPFVRTELDLLAGGDDDARALGVATTKTKLLVLIVTAFATACAFAAGGQIAFVGLLVPHGLRLLTGASHRTLLPLSLLGGAVFLLACDLLQLVLIGDRPLHTGVLMSIVGGPVFLVLLARSGRTAW
jgi:iron complex transport system permease protein